MLQQTTVATVTAYFQKFVELWPSIAKLAAAPVETVLKEWAGLGYYARARNLHKCAKEIVRLGAFPTTGQDLVKLPGIGPYTAAAISSIAFNKRATVVDGNVERVISRLFRLKQMMPDAKTAIRVHAAELTPARRPGDYAQAIMDLGATICTPTSPKCNICPWHDCCAAHETGDPESFPVRPKKAPKPLRQGIAYFVEAEGHVLLCRRPDKGLLGGMVAFPTTGWTESPPLPVPPVKAKWIIRPDVVVHVFTHFELMLTVSATLLQHRIPVDDHFWYPVTRISDAGLPTVFAKVARIMQK
jgi:A/G-specific adenine glycosylase